MTDLVAADVVDDGNQDSPEDPANSINVLSFFFKFMTILYVPFAAVAILLNLLFNAGLTFGFVDPRGTTLSLFLNLLVSTGLTFGFVDLRDVNVLRQTFPRLFSRFLDPLWNVVRGAWLQGGATPIGGAGFIAGVIVSYCVLGSSNGRGWGFFKISF